MGMAYMHGDVMYVTKNLSYAISVTNASIKSETFRFPFPTKGSVTWGAKWDRLNFRRNS